MSSVVVNFFVTGVYVVFKQSLVSSSSASPATTAASSSSASHLFCDTVDARGV